MNCFQGCQVTYAHPCSTYRVSQVSTRKMHQMVDTMMYLDNETFNILYKDFLFFFVFCHLLAFIYEKFRTSCIKTTHYELNKLTFVVRKITSFTFIPIGRGYKVSKEYYKKKYWQY